MLSTILSKHKCMLLFSKVLRNVYFCFSNLHFWKWSQNVVLDWVWVMLGLGMKISTLCGSEAVWKHDSLELVHLGGTRSTGSRLGFVQWKCFDMLPNAKERIANLYVFIFRHVGQVDEVELSQNYHDVDILQWQSNWQVAGSKFIAVGRFLLSRVYLVL